MTKLMSERVSERKCSKQDAIRILREAKETLQTMQVSFLTLGEILYKIMRFELYKHIGFSAFSEYVTIELNRISVEQAIKYARIHEKYRVVLGVEPQLLLTVGIHKLNILLASVTKANCLGLLEKARISKVSEVKTEKYSERIYTKISFWNTKKEAEIIKKAFNTATKHLNKRVTKNSEFKGKQMYLIADHFIKTFKIVNV